MRSPVSQGAHGAIRTDHSCVGQRGTAHFLVMMDPWSCRLQYPNTYSTRTLFRFLDDVLFLFLYLTISFYQKIFDQVIHAHSTAFIKYKSVYSEEKPPSVLWAQSCQTLRLHGWQPTRLFYPWNFPGNNTGVGCHFLLQSLYCLSPQKFPPMFASITFTILFFTLKSLTHLDGFFKCLINMPSLRCLGVNLPIQMFWNYSDFSKRENTNQLQKLMKLTCNSGYRRTDCIVYYI